MASCENKYITLLDLSRQAKVITGETACFDGKIQVGIPFSGYPTGVDTGTTTSLGIISNGIAVFSGGTGTTIFDVSNPLSPNYSPLFSGSSGYVWSNDLFSGNTSGLTLPITPLSAETQVVGPVWAVSQTATTSNGEHIIDLQYTGYSITYSFQDLTTIPITAYTAYSGFCYTTQENFSAGTLDYKGPLDYISTKEDATVEGILTTKKLTVTDGASASTIGYVLTQLDSSGRAGWVFNSASASTNTFVTGGTLNGTNLDLTWNTGGSVPSIELSGLTFTGNTSGDCITDLWLTNLHSCSPLFINPLDEGNVYFGSNSGVTIDLLNGGEMLVKGDAITHSDTNSTSPLNGVVKGQYTEFNWSGITGGIVSNNSTSGVSSYYVGDFSNFPTTRKHGSIRYYGSGYTRSGGATTVASSFYQNKVLIAGGADVDGMVIKPKTGDASGTLWFEVNGSSVAQLYSDSGYFGLGLNPDGTELPTAHLQVGGTGTTGTFKFLDGNEQSGYVMTSDVNGNVSWQVPTFTGLTTTGTTGPSTLVSGTLNVPEYSGGTSYWVVENGGLKDTNANSLSISNTSTGSIMGGGTNNVIAGTSDFSVIMGGGSNTVSSSLDGSIIGGGGNTISGDYTNIICAGTNNYLTNTRRSAIIGGQNITGTSYDTVYVPNLNIGTVGGGASVNNLGIDSSGNVVTGTTGGGGGVTIDPYEDVGNVTSITWDVSGTSTNYEATLTGVTTLNMSNVRNGDYGTLIVTQDGTGSRTLSFVGANHKVVNGGGGAPTLTTTAGATDILSFTYNGTNFYWTVGNDYT